MFCSFTLVQVRPALSERNTPPSAASTKAQTRSGLAGETVTPMRPSTPRGKPERGQPGRDGTRGDEHDVGTPSRPGGESVGQRADAVVVDPAVGGGERGRAHLDHHPGGRGDIQPDAGLRLAGHQPAGPAVTGSAVTGPAVTEPACGQFRAARTPAHATTRTVFPGPSRR